MQGAIGAYDDLNRVCVFKLTLLISYKLLPFRFIKGFILRKQPLCEENRIFICQTRYNFLIRVKAELPKTVLDKSWLEAPELLEEVC